MRALLSSILMVEFIFLVFLVFNELLWESYLVALIFITTFAYAVFGYEGGHRQELSSIAKAKAEVKEGALRPKESKTTKTHEEETKESRTSAIERGYREEVSKEPTPAELKDELEVPEDFFLPKKKER